MSQSIKTSIYLIVIIGIVWILSSFYTQDKTKPINPKPQVVVDGLNHPWAVVFLDENRLLISQRNDDLLLVDQGKKIPLELPIIDVFAQGQGGLLDLALHPDYLKNGWIYLSYSNYDDDLGASIVLARFKLKNQQIQHWQMLYIADAYQHTSHHFGGRIAFDDKNYLYLTIGDRGKRHQAQNTSNDMGTILRLHDDGIIPQDNPFNNAIYSYGHRNPQGLVYHQGQLIAHEHGPRGGDELNIINAGKNYGWPVISYGKEYSSNMPVGIGTHKAGMQQPIHYWVPSIAPSGLAVYPQDNNQQTLLIGSLKFKQVVVLTKNDNAITAENRLFSNEFGRVRDVVVRDNFVYLLTDASNAQLIKLPIKKLLK